MANLNKEKIQDMLATIKDFADAISSEYGVKVNLGTLRWTPNDFTIKITGVVNDTGDDSISGRELEFINNYKANYYRLTGNNLLGKKCYANNRTYVLIGAKPRMGKMPLILKEEGSGKLVSSSTSFFLNNLIKE